MVWLILGLLLFFGVHLLPCFPGVRARLVEWLGEYPWKGVFSLIAGGGLGLMIIGFAYAPTMSLWHTPSWGRFLVVVTMPVALVLFAAAYLPGNIKRLTAHPMLWGVALWGAVHLVVNGELAALLLFGSFVAYALIDMVSARARGARRAVTARPWWNDALTVAVGLAAYWLAMRYHGVLFGPSVM